MRLAVLLSFQIISPVINIITNAFSIAQYRTFHVFRFIFCISHIFCTFFFFYPLFRFNELICRMSGAFDYSPILYIVEEFYIILFHAIVSYCITLTFNVLDYIMLYCINVPHILQQCMIQHMENILHHISVYHIILHCIYVYSIILLPLTLQIM